ncbi:unnamed protein product [Amoebophrya sp. A25]|nr:unnamed protein product [Amoebophrya sp. A25]|eukprot:GSA25T00016296001.1
MTFRLRLFSLKMSLHLLSSKMQQLDERIQDLKQKGNRVKAETLNLQQMRKDRLDPSHKDRFDPRYGYDDDLRLLEKLDDRQVDRNMLLSSLKAIKDVPKPEALAEKLESGEEYSKKAAEYLEDFDTAYIELLKDITERAKSSLVESRNTLESYKKELGENVANSFFTLDAKEFLETKFARQSAYTVLNIYIPKLEEPIKEAMQLDFVDKGSVAGKALMTAKDELPKGLEKQKLELSKVLTQLYDDFATADEKMDEANPELLSLLDGLHSSVTRAVRYLEDLTHAVDEKQASMLVKLYFEAEKNADEAVVKSEAVAEPQPKAGVENGNEILGFMKNLRDEYKKRVAELKKTKTEDKQGAFARYEETKQAQKLSIPEAAQSFLEEVPF